MSERSVAERLQDAFAEITEGMSERDALEQAMVAADGWKMRLEELEQEDDDSEGGDAG